MTESNTVVLELSIREARVISHALSSAIPVKEDEMISYMLYARVTRKLEEVSRKDEQV